MDLWELPIRGPVQPPDLQRDRFGDSLSLGSLPDQLLVAALGREGFAPIPVVVAPAGRDLEGLRFKADADRHPERRREHRFRCRGRRFGGPVLDRSAAPLGKLVELLRGKLLPLGGKHPDEVAVPNALLVDLLLRASDRAKQIVQDHPFQFFSDLRWGR